MNIIVLFLKKADFCQSHQTDITFYCYESLQCPSSYHPCTNIYEERIILLSIYNQQYNAQKSRRPEVALVHYRDSYLGRGASPLLLL